MSICNNSALEELRDARRKRSGRVAYDCYNLKQTSGDTVSCAKGHHLTVNLLGILDGVTPSVCRKCKDYDGGE